MQRILCIVSVIFGLTLASPVFGQGNKYYREYRKHRPPISKEIVRSAPIKDVYVIHLILDGTNYLTLQRSIAEGKMPTLKEEIINKGATFTHAISTFPSTSSCAYQSFITGLMPGHAGIPHLQRLDRQKKRKIDYLTVNGHGTINSDLINLTAFQNPESVDLDNTATIFELLRGHPTLSLYSTIRRGALIKKPRTVPLHALWSTYVTGNINNVDKLAFTELRKVYSRPIDQIPRYSLVGLYSVDIAGHFYGTDSEDVEQMLVQFDQLLKSFMELLEEQGIRQKTYIIVSADHGMHDTGKLFNFRETAIRRGIDVKPMNPRKKDFSLYAADRGISSTHIYIRRPDGSFAPLNDAEELRSFHMKTGEKLDLIDFILSLEPTELVIVRDGERRVTIYDHKGRSSQIECFLLNASQWCSYHILERGDPLMLSGKKVKRLIDGHPHSDKEWMYATMNEYYTDGVVQLGTVFHDGRAGDLFIIPKRSWGLHKVKAATHGSLIRDDMHMPMYMAGPAIPRGTFTAMRTVDVYPLLIEWFGLKVPAANYDGRIPFAGYQPEDSHWQTLAALEQVFSKHPPLIKSIDVRRSLAKEVRSLVKYRHKKKLLKLAKMEEQNRSQLHRKIKQYIDSGGSAKGYAKDHLAIARRIERVTWKRKRVMSDIVQILSDAKMW